MDSTAQTSLTPDDATAQLAAIVESSDDAIISKTLEGVILTWNAGAERLYGYTETEAIGRGMTMLLPEDRPGEEAEILGRIGRGERVEHFETVRRTKSGDRIDVSLTISPTRNKEGKITGASHVARNITDRKRLDEQLATRTEVLERTKQQLRRLAGSLLTAQEQERRRIARELHDDICQRLATVAISLADIIKQQTSGEIAAAHGGLNELRDEIDRLSADVRNLSHRLHPSVLDDFGLVPALRSLVQQFESMWPHRVALSVTDVWGDIPVEVSYAFYRIAQEALRNIQKHAQAADVTVSLSGSSGELYLKIADNGPGFDPNRTAAGRGLGLISIQERALLANARLSVHSQSGLGTRIEVRVPLPEEP